MLLIVHKCIWFSESRQENAMPGAVANYHLVLFLVTSTRSYPMSAMVCSGQTGSIYCPQLKLLKIKSAIYGKQQGRDCAGRPTRDSVPTCYARDTMPIVKNMCDGQQSCDLFTDQGFYGKTTCDPSIAKYLQVDYTCEGHSNLDSKLGVKGAL